VLPTSRLLLLFLLTAVLAAIPGIGRTLAAVIGLLLIALAALDWRLSGDGAGLGVVRTVEPKLSLAEWNVVTLALSNPTPRDMRVLVRDAAPVDFEIEPAGSAIAGEGCLVGLAPSSTDSIAYRLRPKHRGDYVFGAVWLRVDGPLGLARRQYQMAGTEQPVRVYPSLKQLRRYELLVRRGLLAEAGSNALRRLGASTEFERLRDYLPDDDFRRINWKATARHGKPIVNEFQEERGQNVVLMLDAGRLMGARADMPANDEANALLRAESPVGLTKLDYALNAAMLLAYVASLRGDRVALLAYTDGVRVFIPPTRGRPAFLKVVEALYNLAPEAVEPDHALAFQFLASRNLRRSLAVLFTDIADQESSGTLVAHVLRAAKQHLVVCVTLNDPTVIGPAAASPTDAQSLYQKMVAQKLLDDRATVLATLAQRGVHTLDTDAGKLSPRLIDTYLELKQRARV